MQSLEERANCSPHGHGQRVSSLQTPRPNGDLHAHCLRKKLADPDEATVAHSLLSVIFRNTKYDTREQIGKSRSCQSWLFRDAGDVSVPCHEKKTLVRVSGGVDV